MSIEQTYDTLRTFVSCLVHSNQKSLVIEGEAGIGKTKAVHLEIAKQKVVECYISGNLTHKGFIKRLQDVIETRETMVVVLDDLDGILRDKMLVATLKGLLSNEIVIYETHNERIEFKPNPNLKFIMIANQYPKHFEPIRDRSLYLELRLSYYDKLDIMEEISAMDYGLVSAVIRKEIFEYIKHHTNTFTKDFSLRTLFKAYNLYIVCKKLNKQWKEYVNQLIQVDKNLAIVEQLVNNSSFGNERERIEKFNETTGLSRATYYRYKASISNT